jgi:hypothetical protein
MASCSAARRSAARRAARIPSLPNWGKRMGPSIPCTMGEYWDGRYNAPCPDAKWTPRQCTRTLNRPSTPWRLRISDDP